MSAATLRAWRNAVFAIFFLSGLGLASWVSRVPAVRDSLDLSTADVGIVIFGLSGGSVLGLVIATPMLARFGARRAMVLGIGAAALGLVVVGIGTGVLPAAAVVIVGLALFGLGTGSVDVIMNVEGAAAERAIGKTLMPLMHACFSLGTVVGALLGAGASFVELSVLAHLVIMAVLVFGTVLVAVRFIPVIAELGDEGPAHTGAIAVAKPVTGWRDRLRENLSVWRDMKLLLIGVIVLGMTFAEGSANDWLALAAVDGHGLSNTLAAIVFGVFVAAMTVGRVLGGPLLDRFGRVPVLRACAVTGIVGLLLFILAPTVWLVFVGTVLWGLGASLGFPVGMSAAADDTTHAAARVSAVAMIGYFAFLVGPPVLGLLGEAWGILNALLVILALMVLAGFAAPAARKPVEAPQPQQTP
ncbi:MFS transporter [Cryobacterium frigoriphilum]|uniref:MFS transporter n=1 Tax=Cryobacterium frigoriphilum TaxID=1259150 RepID=A0A4R8ZWC3_9MICO|nr:MFS transporter [Cryobacterium frigoriphilum]TFD47883.1 MFS transporter [Cryobacterium frigoriphilum]